MDFNTFISKRPVLLAPMAGITDTAFREMCLKYGAELAYTEMISAKGMHYNCMATRKLIELSEREGPCGVQLFGSSPDILADISREIEIFLSPNTSNIVFNILSILCGDS